MREKNNENTIHTVIFDMDGTLTDTAVLTMISFRRHAPGFGLRVPTIEEVKKMMGYANPEFFYHLFPDVPQSDLDEIGQKIWRGEMDALKTDKDILFDGCRELLEILSAAGIKMYIASTGSREHVYTILTATGIIDFFDMIACGLSDKTEAVREMIKGSDPGGFVFVGDMVKDYVAARENGIVSVGACYGYCDRNDADFDHYIDFPLALLDIFQFRAIEDDQEGSS